ncbi:hypothetical protein LINPERHAP2_LOCUS34301 [Linum perenne]
MKKYFSFLAMKRRLEFLWARSGPIQVSDMTNNFFLVRFASKDDYAIAAFEGPWKIYDYYIAVSQWSPSFNEEEAIKSILTWVRLPRLPIQYFNTMAVQRIGNFIGKAVRVDIATSEGSRCRYARVCVELDLTKPLLGTYMIEDRVLKIEYESLENMCFDCGLYGHKKEACQPLPHRDKGENVVSMTKEPEVQTEQELTGEWMTVQRRNRKKAVKGPTQQRHLGDNGSRFSALQSNVPESSNKPVGAVPETCVSEPVVVLEEEAQLVTFKRILDEALTSQAVADKLGPEIQRKQSMGKREALRDVSNSLGTAPAAKTTKKNAGSGNFSKEIEDLLKSDEGLIPVEVVY